MDNVARALQVFVFFFPSLFVPYVSLIVKNEKKHKITINEEKKGISH